MSQPFLYGAYDKEEMKRLILAAESSPELEGFVRPDDEGVHRLPIFFKKELVGFATPRQEDDGFWRMGAIYVKPAFRRRGLASKAIREFMAERKGRAVIEDENLASQRAFAAAGFTKTRKASECQGYWWERKVNG